MSFAEQVSLADAATACPLIERSCWHAYRRGLPQSSAGTENPYGNLAATRAEKMALGANWLRTIKGFGLG